MLAFMTLELQKQHETMDMSSILTHLHDLYDNCKVVSILYDCELAERGLCNQED